MRFVPGDLVTSITSTSINRGQIQINGDRWCWGDHTVSYFSPNIFAFVISVPEVKSFGSNTTAYHGVFYAITPSVTCWLIDTHRTSAFKRVLAP